MSRLFHHLSVKLMLLAIIGITIITPACSAKGEGFAIYLTREDIPPAKMEALSHVQIADQPLISLKDVVYYNSQSHELKLTPSAFERINALQGPVQGKSFLVCVNKAPIYWGAFWTPVSSISFDGVTIWKPYNSQEATIVTLELGYPSADFYGGQDPRNNTEVIKSLEKAGKLIPKLTIQTINQLPRSFKGYELYSWKVGEEWHFTLITGTNRNKTLAEIISAEDFISEIGWINIHMVGVEAVKTALGKLPAKEYVFWLDGRRLAEGDQAEAKISIPAGPTIDAIKQYALEQNLDFSVPEHN